MSVRWERFSGDTSKFALKVAFHADPDEGAAMDADTAASWGAMQVWVDGVNLCSHVDQGETLQSSHWYVLPILEWLVSSWEPLLHEERLPSSSNRFVTAADLASVTPALLFADVGASDALALDERRYEWESATASEWLETEACCRIYASAAFATKSRFHGTTPRWQAQPMRSSPPGKDEASRSQAT